MNSGRVMSNSVSMCGPRSRICRCSGSCATTQLVRLAQGTRIVRAARGEMLFNKGDVPNGFFLVV